MLLDEQVKTESTEEVVKTEEVKTSTPEAKPATEAKPTEVVAADKAPAKKEAPKRPAGPRKLSINRSPMRRGQQSEFEERVIDIARVTTVVKGGRRFSFSAFVVVGNKKGKVGYGHGKANEVPDAIKKAIKDARGHMINVPIIDKRTVPHDQVGRFLASKILVKPAPKGKGIIASGAIRQVVELAGYKDIYTKSLGSRSKANSVKATLDALNQLRTIEEIAKLRDVKVSDILG